MQTTTDQDRRTMARAEAIGADTVAIREASPRGPRDAIAIYIADDEELERERILPAGAIAAADDNEVIVEGPPAGAERFLPDERERSLNPGDRS